MFEDSAEISATDTAWACYARAEYHRVSLGHTIANVSGLDQVQLGSKTLSVFSILD